MCEASAANHKMSRVPSRTTRFNNIYTDLLSWKKEIKEFPPISNSRLRVFGTLGFVLKIETKVKIFSYAKIIGGYIFVYLSSFVSKYWARIEESLLLLADIFTFVLESNVFHEFFFPRIARIHNLPACVNAKNCETKRNLYV